MKLRLFLDEDVHLALAGALRKRGYDATHTGEEAPGHDGQRPA